jgi:hypothetical protein
VEPEIKPDPSPEERAAILKALDASAADSTPEAYRSGWRREGIGEGLEAEPED